MTLMSEEEKNARVRFLMICSICSFSGYLRVSELREKEQCS